MPVSGSCSDHAVGCIDNSDSLFSSGSTGSKDVSRDATGDDIQTTGKDIEGAVLSSRSKTLVYMYVSSP